MATDLVNSREGAAAQWPDAQGRFGRFGGKYAPETLMPALDELEAAYREARSDPSFQAEIDWLAKHYVGRPTPVYYAANLTEYAGGVINRSWPADIVLCKPIDFSLKRRIAARLAIRRFELVERGHQRFRGILAAESSKSSLRVRPLGSGAFT